jgi:hypothetical protein
MIQTYKGHPIDKRCSPLVVLLPHSPPLVALLSHSSPLVALLPDVIQCHNVVPPGISGPFTGRRQEGKRTVSTIY